jgi:hypothetical protein
MPPTFISGTSEANAATKLIKKKKNSGAAHRTVRKSHHKIAHRTTRKGRVVSRAKTRKSAHAVTRRVARVAAGDLNTTVWPDPTRTPGWTNPNVTQSNIRSTICRSGWTDTIRPPTSYTNALKTRQIQEYGFGDSSLASYEEDHLISLQLGGHPTEPRNLWPQPYAGVCGARVKDVIETKLKRLVCAGQVTLAEAQQWIAQNWVGAYIRYVHELNCPIRR